MLNSQLKTLSLFYWRKAGSECILISLDEYLLYIDWSFILIVKSIKMLRSRSLGRLFGPPPSLFHVSDIFQKWQWPKKSLKKNVSVSNSYLEVSVRIFKHYQVQRNDTVFSFILGFYLNLKLLLKITKRTLYFMFN
jgi:hypothetical protein